MRRHYNPELIQAAIAGRKHTRKQCRLCASKYAKLTLPDEIIQRIYSRKRLYYFLESFDYSDSQIKAIFHEFNLPVPRDKTLPTMALPKEEQRPSWLDYCDSEEIY